MNPRVVSVQPVEDFRLALVFDDQQCRLFDCRPLLSLGVFSQLSDPEYFRKVRAFNGTVVWPHEQDICPDTLFEDSIECPPGFLSRL